MAFLSDVQTLLRQRVAAILYPTTPTDSQPSTVCNCVVTVQEGWPLSASVDKVLASGNAMVSVYSLPGMERPTTRYQDVWQTVAAGTPSVTLTVGDQEITVGGTATAGNIVVAIIGNAAYPYVVQAEATLVDIASALLALIQVDYPGATASGTVITPPGTANLIAVQTGAPGTASRPIRTAEQGFQITAWAPTPVIRTSIKNAIDAVLSDVKRMLMPDGTMTRIIYKRQQQTDLHEKVLLYRGDLFYQCEYTVIETETFAPVLINTLNLMVQAGSIPVSNTSVRMGVTYINGSQLAELWIGNTAPSSAGPFLWLQTDKPTTDPTYTVIKEQYGP